MQESGNFEIHFIKNYDKDYVNNLVERMNGANADEEVDDDMILSEEWGNVCFDERACRIYSNSDSSDFIDDDTYDYTLNRISRMIAMERPEISFDGFSEYSNLSVGYDKYESVTYRGGERELVIKELSGIDTDGFCPECGEQLFTPYGYDPNKEYYCSKCKTKVIFDVEYCENVYILEEGQFILQS